MAGAKPKPAVLYLKINVGTMKALILAAGYGTRLARDLDACADKYPDLVGVPKPLLPVSGCALITHWIRMLFTCPEVTDVYVVVNAKYYDQFVMWNKEFSRVQLVCDGTSCNEERLGAVACMELAVRHFDIQDDLIVIGGDTLFYEDFSLAGIIDNYMSGLAKKEEGALVSCYKCKDEETFKFGIVEVDNLGKITSFLEKPLPSATQSRLACPCFYLLSRASLKLLPQFLEDKKNCPLSDRDATGHFLRYLSERKAVYTHVITGRFDVGGLQSYLECCSNYKL